MTSESASQSISAGRTDDIPPGWDERIILTTFLAYARDTVHAKCAGPSGSDARRAPLPGSPLLADYRAACTRHRDQVASLNLDTPSRGELGWRTEPVTLRWVLFHLTEETARHDGHLDILRELADGARGR